MFSPYVGIGRGGGGLQGIGTHRVALFPLVLGMGGGYGLLVCARVGGSAYTVGNEVTVVFGNQGGRGAAFAHPGASPEAQFCVVRLVQPSAVLGQDPTACI